MGRWRRRTIVSMILSMGMFRRRTMAVLSFMGWIHDGMPHVTVSVMRWMTMIRRRVRRILIGVVTIITTIVTSHVITWWGMIRVRRVS